MSDDILNKFTGIRVDARPLSRNATDEDKDRAFKGMYAAFKRLVNETGILTEYNRKQSFESKGQKRRRKKKESALARMKQEMEKKDDEIQTRWRENFGKG